VHLEPGLRPRGRFCALQTSWSRNGVHLRMHEERRPAPLFQTAYFYLAQVPEGIFGDIDPRASRWGVSLSS